MSSEHGSVRLWRTRLTWAALGAGVTALLCWTVHPGASPSGTKVARDFDRSRPTASPGSNAEVSVERLDPAVTKAGAHVPATGAETDSFDPSTGGAEAGMGGNTSTGGIGGGTGPLATSTGGTEAGTGGYALPRIPLPRMPGTRFMRQARSADEQTGGSLVVLGLSVPAPGSQVEAFYRRALKDAGMRVFGGSDAPSSMGQGHRTTLKGRGKEASAEITIHQRAGRLRSVVRIYWRIKP